MKSLRCPLCGEEEQIYILIIDDPAERAKKIHRMQCWHCKHTDLASRFKIAYKVNGFEPEFSGTDYWSKINFYRNNFDN